MDYKSRSVRLADDVWSALQHNEFSANQLLRVALGLPFGSARNVAEKAMEQLDAEPKPRRKQSKKAAHVEALKSADVVAQKVGREDIEYGEHTELPQGENVATLDAVGSTSGQGKVSFQSWRAGRKPLLKPGDRK